MILCSWSLDDMYVYVRASYDIACKQDLKTSLTKFENHQNSTPKFADCREAKLLAVQYVSREVM